MKGIKGIWREIDKIHNFCNEAGDFGKLSDLEATDVWGFLIDSYSFKGTETKAILFRVRNRENEHFHNVVIVKHDKKLRIWCNDLHLQKIYPEAKCWFWRNFQKGKPHCKHIAFVLQYLDHNPDMKKRIEELLTEKEEAGVRAKIHLAIRLSKPILLYGPTGSGKTHTAMEVSFNPL